METAGLPEVFNLSKVCRREDPALHDYIGKIDLAARHKPPRFGRMSAGDPRRQKRKFLIWTGGVKWVTTVAVCALSGPPSGCMIPPL